MSTKHHQFRILDSWKELHINNTCWKVNLNLTNNHQKEITKDIEKHKSLNNCHSIKTYIRKKVNYHSRITVILD